MVVIWKREGKEVIAVTEKPAEKPKSPKKGKKPKKDKGKK
jgi:hypothetical protein